MENKTKLAAAISALTGVGVWLGICLASGKLEAWDSTLYWKMGLPLSALAAGISAALAPAKPWRWGLLVMVAQALTLFAQNPTGNLMPLGLILFGVLSIPCVLAALLVGTFISLRARRSPPTG